MNWKKNMSKTYTFPEEEKQMAEESSLNYSSSFTIPVELPTLVGYTVESLTRRELT